jgi:hypothetical protein
MLHGELTMSELKSDRRTAFMSISGAITGLAALPDPAAAAGDDMPDLSNPEENLRAIIRTSASQQEDDCPWYYNGTIFGIVGEEAPRPLYRFEGMEMYLMRHVSPGMFEMIGNTVTFMRDIDTGAFLREWKNPYTEALNKVEDAVQGGKAGRGFEYSVNGIRPTMFKDQFADKPLKLWWTAAGDYVWLHNSTVYPPGMKPPRLQRQTNFMPRAQFVDRGRDSIASMFSSTVFMPWPKWMDMGDRPGHVVWHASGVKLKSIAELPAEYRARAEKDYPDRMTLKAS